MLDLWEVRLEHRASRMAEERSDWAQQSSQCGGVEVRLGNMERSELDRERVIKKLGQVRVTEEK